MKVILLFLPGDTNQSPESKAICSDHCQLLQVIEFCSAEVYKLLLEDNQLSMPDCSKTAISSIPKTGPNCMPVTLSHTIEDHHRHGKSTSIAYVIVLIVACKQLCITTL